MKRLFTILAVCSALALSGVADAKGGSSSGGGGHASSGGGRSSSSISSGSRGGFSSGSVARAPSAAPSRSTTTTTTTTHTYRSQYVSPGPMYGGWGMGYGYSNGLLTGMIIGGMMHPYHTVMYVGPGPYANNALLYPDGRVVNQQGYQVGTYVNGQFTPVQNGAMVAQQVPADAGQQVAQPVVINTGPSFGDICAMIFLGFIILILFIVLFGVLL